MKLFYKPGACSLASHIVAREAGFSPELEKVNTAEGKTEKGADFRQINPKGYVPTLQLDDGQYLTEGAAIMQYLADQKPEASLAPKNGSMDRYRFQEWLNYVGTEFHKAYSPLFNPKANDEFKNAQREGIAKKLSWVDAHFAKSEFLMGSQFTAADAYLFVVLNWSGRVGVDVKPYANVAAWQKRVGSRPAVQAAMKAEGLI